MTTLDILLLAIRWVHGLAAVAWLGGGLFYLIVLGPARRDASDASTTTASQAVDVEFSNVVDVCIITLLVTGTVLAFARLTSDVVGVAYAVTLGIKISLSLYMFWVVWSQRRRRQRYISDHAYPKRPPHRLASPFLGPNSIVTIGIIVFLLADVLRLLVEKALAHG